MDGSRAQAVLAPFRDGSAKPVLDKIGAVPDILTLSHAADASLTTAPRRLVIRGTMFADFFPELLKAVWDRWVAFTETSEEVRGSAVIWDLTVPDKMAAVPPDATALKRMPYYWMAVQGRYMALFQSTSNVLADVLDICTFQVHD